MSPTARHPHTLCRKVGFSAACATGTAGPWELMLEWGEGGAPLIFCGMLLFSRCLRLGIRKHKVMRARDGATFVNTIAIACHLNPSKKARKSGLFNSSHVHKC